MALQLLHPMLGSVLTGHKPSCSSDLAFLFDCVLMCVCCLVLLVCMLQVAAFVVAVCMFDVVVVVVPFTDWVCVLAVVAPKLLC